MLGRSTDDAHTREIGFLPPGRLRDSFGRHAPLFQMGAHSQRDEERDSRAGQIPDGFGFQVIVMVMGDDHGVDAGQLLAFQKRGLETLGADGHRRSVAPEYGIDEETLSLQFQQQGGMPEPYDLEVGGWLPEGA